ncbi:M23 family metallopeptidase [Bradyrhizobium sp. JYMT SZCCT0428]|uniref:M23 family metallopeptidase n=1 Tax=Bradyrhizobium sp. JYMT SZCCT0428 TaxID=2807673 RepID=UPI002012CFC0|nr:M23 family metallopeptidase [Bradyrhizobium sp. JYMT SZCCT0428]
MEQGFSPSSKTVQRAPSAGWIIARRVLRVIAVFFAQTVTSGTSAEDDNRPLLILPIRCHLGSDCYIQNFVDHDEDPKGASDYNCGERTYDGHNGTDFRLPDLKAASRGVDVLAAAPGRIKAIRDGIQDVSVRVGGDSSVAGKECGNGIIIEHKADWSTQYCHLAKGTIRVRTGDQVSAGDPIGRVGLSGKTEFSHLHFTVRRGNLVVDPFAYGAPPSTCRSGTSLWDPALGRTIDYRDREIINSGFASTAVSMDLIESGEILSRPASPHAPLVAYVRAIGLKPGDVQAIKIEDAEGKQIARYEIPAITTAKAQAFITVGSAQNARPWTGAYTGYYNVRNNGQVTLEKTFKIEIVP